MNKNLPKKWQIIEIDEKKVEIKYKGIENKGPRPYLIISPNISHKKFLAVPFTAKKNKDIKYFWIEHSYQVDSIIKLDHLTLFDYKDFKHIKMTNYFLPSWKKQLAKDKLTKLLTE